MVEIQSCKNNEIQFNVKTFYTAFILKLKLIKTKKFCLQI